MNTMSKIMQIQRRQISQFACVDKTYATLLKDKYQSFDSLLIVGMHFCIGNIMKYVKIRNNGYNREKY